jgi:hypothetical protein
MARQRFILSLYLLTLFAAALAYMLVTKASGVDVLLGALVVAVGAVPKWFFDSSPGSDRKTELLAQAGPVPTPTEEIK